MKFQDASAVEQICYDLRLADYPRSLNRTRINNLFNGIPPFADDEANKVNVNPLNGTVMSHDARAQFYGAFLRPGKFFTADTDYGPKHKRGIYSGIVTEQINKRMKRCLNYFETFRSKFAMDVLHGIGPSAWRDSESWCPDAIAIEDVGIPANTLLTMENLPFFYIYRSFTLPEIKRLTAKARASHEVGWNMELVSKLEEWIDKETSQLMGTNWPEIWSPEKTAERIKGDGGFYASDQVPTINVFDFYFWNDDDRVQGWNRRMILDAWSEPQSSGGGVSMAWDKSKEFARNQFLFDSGERKYASELSELITFQFADLSAVAPFRYHSVRSLGYLLYGVCQLQNRMFCRFNESAFEATLNYLRINSPDDADRALKIDLINRGVIDKSVQFVPQAERWQVNAALIEAAMNENRRIVDQNSSSYTAQPNQGGPGDRKTKFQVQAEIAQTTALVQSGFNQAYRYQEAEYYEILRRFMRPDSTDIGVKQFRAACLKRGVPEKVLNFECWDLHPTQVMGAGNKTLEMAISEQLLQMRPLFDPEPQREILREVTFNLTGDAEKSERWVPDEPVKVTDSVHDAELACGALMQGIKVSLKTGINHAEYVATMMKNLGQMVQAVEQGGGMAPMDKIQGFAAISQNIKEHLQVLGQDKNEKPFVTRAAQMLSKLDNLIRAFAQRMQEQQKKQQQAAQQGNPEQAKIQAAQQLMQLKLKGKQADTQQKLQQKEQEFKMQMQHEQIEFNAEQHRQNLEALHEMTRGQISSMSDEGGGE